MADTTNSSGTTTSTTSSNPSYSPTQILNLDPATLATLQSGNQDGGVTTVTGGGSASTANFTVTGVNFVIAGDDTSDTIRDNSTNTITTGSLTGQGIIFGLGGADSITVGTGVTVATVFGGTGTFDTTDGADTIAMGTAGGIVYANAGNDSVSFSSTAAITIAGGLGNDTVTGTGSGTTTGTGAALVYGGAGADSLNLASISGNHTIFGGSGLGDSSDGSDTITTGTGNSTVYANGGADSVTVNSTSSASVFGGFGNDTITTAAGVNGVEFISGGQGQDSITVTSGTGTTLTIFGGDGIADTSDGADVITIAANTAAGGQAVIYGNAGNDTITQTAGLLNATIYGGLGNDLITVAGGNHYIIGADGNDSITIVHGVADSASAVDTIDAGVGSDIISVSGGIGSVIATGGGNDSVTIATAITNLSLDVGAHGDTLETDSNTIIFSAGIGANNTILGGSGSDVLTDTAGGGLVGANTLINLGDGTNTLTAVTTGAYDSVIGGSGNDSFALTTSIGDHNSFTLGDGTNSLVVGTAQAANATIVTPTDLVTSLTVTGGAGNDNIDLHNVVSTANNGGVVTVTGGAGDDSIHIGLNQFYVSGGAGNDHFTFSTVVGAINDTVDHAVITDSTGFTTTSTTASGDVFEFDTVASGSFATLTALTTTGAVNGIFGEVETVAGAIDSTSTGGTTPTIDGFAAATTGHNLYVSTGVAYSTDTTAIAAFTASAAGANPTTGNTTAELLLYFNTTDNTAHLLLHSLTNTAGTTAATNADIATFSGVTSLGQIATAFDATSNTGTALTNFESHFSLVNHA